MVKRLVVKVGTSSLAYNTGRFNLGRMDRLARELSDLRNRGIEVILVSSGAIGAGVGRLGLAQRPRTIPEKQAAAAIGQGLLMQLYERFFSEYGQIVAQVLITGEDIMDRKRYLNARNSLLALFGYGAIPVINENDTVAVDEIKIGNNDTLSALVASLIDADTLILLTDIDGLYTADPRKNPDAKLLTVVDDITPEIESAAGGTGSALASGGMLTKIKAARIAMNSGIKMIIANASLPDVITRIVEGEQIGTSFLPSEQKLASRKRWFAFGLPVKGELTVDDGAKKMMLSSGKSLLPSGIVDTGGDYETGDLVSICDREGREFARGLVNYSMSEIKKILGLHSGELENVLGYKYSDEVVHRDNLVCLT